MNVNEASRARRMVWSADDFMPTQVVKGDYVGHPFRGNQWSDSSGASTGAGPSAESPDQVLADISNPWGGMFGGQFDLMTDTYKIDEQGITDFLARQHSDLSITANEKESIKRWQQYGHYREINAVLRGERKLEELEPKGGTIERAIGDLNRVFTQATLDQDVTVFRGINDDEFMFEDTSKGDIITDKGFIATSLNPLMAVGASLGFIEDEGRDDIINSLMFRIKIPKGTPAISADRLDGTMTDPDGPFLKPDKALLADQGFTYSAEIVLPPNTRFKVVREHWIKMQRTLDLEVIPNA